MGQALHMFHEAVGVAPLDRLHDACVQHPATILQQASVCHLVRQRMLEGVLEIREYAGFVQELSGLQVRQILAQALIGKLGDGLQQREGHVLANDCASLEQALVLGCKPVDACCQDGLHRGRHVDAVVRSESAVRRRDCP